MTFNPVFYGIISLSGLLLTACSPINSNFSCNATAGDHCLTIEQVDSMTQYADGNTVYHTPHSKLSVKQRAHFSQDTRDTSIWIATRDSSLHQNQLGE